MASSWLITQFSASAQQFALHTKRAWQMRLSLCQPKCLHAKTVAFCCCSQVPGLQPYQHQLEEIYWRFNAYKQTIPTMGAIILEPSMEKCLLVKGWRAADGWGFPTGKINKDESDEDCAVREARCTAFQPCLWLCLDDTPG